MRRDRTGECLTTTSFEFSPRSNGGARSDALRCPTAVAHADRFVRALPADATSVVDLGSGGGLPGLVVAHRRRDLRVTLIERRAKRVDLLRYGIRVLELSATTDVFDGQTSKRSPPHSTQMPMRRGDGPQLWTAARRSGAAAPTSSDPAVWS